MKKRSDGRYRSKVTFPNGQVKYVYGYSMRELKENKEELLLQYAQGATNVDKRILVRDWAEKWWKADKEGKTGDKSQRGYVSALNNYIIPSIGNLRIIDVKNIYIQELINNMGKQGLSKSLQNKVLITLNAMFVYAIRNGIIPYNPAQYIELYEVPVNERTALTPPQIEQVLEVCKETRAELAIHLALYCGLRRGEIAALQWADINDDHRVIMITRSVEFINNRPREKGPKSKAGYRIIPVPTHLWDMLKSAPRKSIYVAPSAKNTQMSEMSARWLIRTVQNQVDFEVTWHILRHTYATIIDKIGISGKSCQYLLGHAELKTTKNIYTHIQDEHLDIISQQLQDIFNISVRGSEGGQIIKLNWHKGLS